MKLLTVNNPKTQKGEKEGFLTAILHLSPATVGGFKTVCPWSTQGCESVCLNTAGRGGLPTPDGSPNRVQKARRSRTELYFIRRNDFFTELNKEITAFRLKSFRLGLKPAIRLDGTSDLGLARHIAPNFPDIQFYDYTKSASRAITSNVPNWHLTFSKSESNDVEVAKVLDAGTNVAVVFDTPKGKELPAFWQDYPVVDGDVSDLRFLDPKGVIVGLRAKGKAKKDTSGFVVKA